MKRSAIATVHLVLCSALAATGCEDGTSSPSGEGPVVTTPPGDPGSPSPAEPSCAPPRKGPTVHEGDVAAGEVWSADASPHIVAKDVTIRSGHTLTIEPCAEVRVAKDASLRVAFPGTPNAGALVAEGTAKRPIRITGNDGARWSSIFVHAPGTARLAHVTIEGGGANDLEHGASLVAVGDGVDGADALVFVDHVTIAKSRGTGAWLQRGATFASGSRDLTIRESGSDPIEIEEHALDALPSGSYTGNARDEILLDPRGGQNAGSGILDDATIHDRGVPYRVGRSKGASLVVGGRIDERLVTLTIEPGVVMRFVEGGSLRVQHATREEPSTAAIRAVGEAARPIVLTSAASAPTPGAWQGLWFGGIPDPSNVIDHVRIEYAGGDCGCILGTCSAITEHEGAIILTGQPAKAFVTNTTFVSINVQAVATDGVDVYFVGGDPTFVAPGITEKLFKCPKAGCAAETASVFASTTTSTDGKSWHYSIVVDSTHVYWSTIAGTILRCPKAGASCATPELLAEGVRPASFAQDEKFLYWADRRGGIYRLPK